MDERTRLNKSEGASASSLTALPQAETQTIRVLEADELERIHDIDRSEVIRTGYRVENSRLVRMDVNWNDGGWHEGDGKHSFGQMIRGARRHLDLGGTAIGAFDGDRLVGIATYQPRLRESMGQLALLHVSHGYRRRGIASALFEEVLTLARRDGASGDVVREPWALRARIGGARHRRRSGASSPAAPTQAETISAVGFYKSKGFAPTSEPDPALLEEEPEDIHMILEI